MKISIEKHSGFCFGVRKAVEMAEELLEKGEKVYCLGEIVHNETELHRLISKGLEIIEHQGLQNLENANVLFRAHGEPPETYEIARRNHLHIIDGTCPVVLGLQRKIQKKARENPPEASQILIYGKDGHAEVEGLKGHSGYRALVVRNIADLEKAGKKKKMILFSQTTMDSEGFREMSAALENLNKGFETEINNTICRHISHREPGLREFAKKQDVIIFVSGRKSSNGRVLFGICQQENPRSYFISESSEIQPQWFENAKTIGVSGATSTPVWMLEEVVQYIKSFTKT